MTVKSALDDVGQVQSAVPLGSSYAYAYASGQFDSGQCVTQQAYTGDSEGRTEVGIIQYSRIRAGGRSAIRSRATAR